MFYFTIGNIHPYYRSTIWHIYLLSIACTLDIEKYGIDEVLKPFMDEIRDFEKVCFPLLCYIEASLGMWT